jgi:hypothetical protein
MTGTKEGKAMKTTMTIRALMMTATLAVMGATNADARALRTPPIQPGAGQKLVCTVVNVYEKGIEMQAQVIDRFGDNATDFARTDWNADETTVVTLRVESSNPNARFCKITVVGGHRSDVEGTLQACSADETICGDPVVAR